MIFKLWFREHLLAACRAGWTHGNNSHTQTSCFIMTVSGKKNLETKEWIWLMVPTSRTGTQELHQGMRQIRGRKWNRNTYKVREDKGRQRHRKKRKNINSWPLSMAKTAPNSLVLLEGCFILWHLEKTKYQIKPFLCPLWGTSARSSFSLLSPCSWVYFRNLSLSWVFSNSLLWKMPNQQWGLLVKLYWHSLSALKGESHVVTGFELMGLQSLKWKLKANSGITHI